MKKILIVFDGSHYSEGALQFIAELHRRGPVYIVAAFLPLVDYSVLWSRSGSKSEGSLSAVLLEDADMEEVKANIEQFSKFCNEHLISYEVHKDFNDFAIPALKKESRFADLVIIGSERFYEQANIHGSNAYLDEALHDMECPVMIVPEKFDFPTHTILAYDGSSASTFAIRQFAYLMPELHSNDTFLVYASGRKDEIPNKEFIKELVELHFQNVKICRLVAGSRDELAAWLQGHPGSIIVSGSYGRTGISRMFHKSFIAEVIGEHRMPVFIAHW